jgi:RNA polymerase sigma-70 factor (ECF subfamily)
MNPETTRCDAEEERGGATSDDAELILAWRDGSQQAGDLLISRHFAAIYRFFANKVREEATDLAQCTFARLIEHVDELQNLASFRAYLFTIARNLLHTHLRTRSRHPAIFDPLSTSMAAIATSPSQAIARGAAMSVLREAMHKLTLEEFEIIELHYWEGLTLREMAQVMGIPLGTMKSRMARAMMMLRANMDEVQRTRKSTRLA